MAWSTWASTKWPMRALAITGMETASMIWWTSSGSLMRATPPWTRMSAGTRSRAMTATAPASSAILAWSAVTTSMMTPPLSISARPRLTRAVPVTWLLDSMLEHSSVVVEAPPGGGVLPAQGTVSGSRLHQRGGLLQREQDRRASRLGRGALPSGGMTSSRPATPARVLLALACWLALLAPAGTGPPAAVAERPEALAARPVAGADQGLVRDPPGGSPVAAG